MGEYLLLANRAANPPIVITFLIGAGADKLDQLAATLVTKAPPTSFEVGCVASAC
jgi:hypothetical protein